MKIEIIIKEMHVHISATDAQALQSNAQQNEAFVEQIVMECEDCGWSKGYASATSAKRGLNAHRGHCPGPQSVEARANRLFKPKK